MDITTVRRLLEANNFAFCDNGMRESEFRDTVCPVSAPGPAGAAWQQPLRDAGRIEDVPFTALLASSMDDPSQGPSCVTRNDGSFWSSSGTTEADARDVVESIVLAASAPLLLTGVHLEPYRARYQYGSPIYPPLFLSVATAWSPQGPWSSFSPRTVVPRTDMVHLIDEVPMPASLPLGPYVCLRLHGKCQRQLEDLAFYTCIRRVRLSGVRLSPHDMRAVAARRRTTPVPTARDALAYLAARPREDEDEEMP